MDAAIKRSTLKSIFAKIAFILGIPAVRLDTVDILPSRCFRICFWSVAISTAVVMVVVVVIVIIIIGDDNNNNEQ
jgi:hypothetical protein